MRDPGLRVDEEDGRAITVDDVGDRPHELGRDFVDGHDLGERGRQREQGARRGLLAPALLECGRRVEGGGREARVRLEDAALRRQEASAPAVDGGQATVVTLGRRDIDREPGTVAVVVRVEQDVGDRRGVRLGEPV